MLSKCANPGCSAAFFYLHQGKLFRCETGSQTQDSSDAEIKKSARRIEFFWLCENCAASMTVSFKDGEGLTVQPMARAHASGL
jgi:hypothetical protein